MRVTLQLTHKEIVFDTDSLIEFLNARPHYSGEQLIASIEKIFEFLNEKNPEIQNDILRAIGIIFDSIGQPQNQSADQSIASGSHS